MIITFIICFVGLIALLIFLYLRNSKPTSVAISVKVLTSLFFIFTLAAALIYRVVKGADIYTVIIPGILTSLALVCGLIGDYSLDLKLLFQKRGEDHDGRVMTWIGMEAFAIGHLFNIACLYLRHPGTYWLILFSLLIGFGMGLATIVGSKKLLKMEYERFKGISLIYASILATFFVYSILVAINTGDWGLGQILIIIGSLLFIFSDMILSMQYFSPNEKYSIKGWQNPESKMFICLNHITYYVAQFVLAIAILFI